MKLLIGLAAICGSSSSVTVQPSVEANFLVVEQARVARKRKTVRGGQKRSEWKPTLSSITEDEKKIDNSTKEQPVTTKAKRWSWRMNLKRKVSAVSQTQLDRTRSSKLMDPDHARKVALSRISFAAFAVG